MIFDDEVYPKGFNNGMALASYRFDPGSTTRTGVAGALSLLFPFPFPISNFAQQFKSFDHGFMALH